MNGIGGTLFLTNNTLADNSGGSSGGISSRGGTVLLLNTILAQNIDPRPGGFFSPDCVGSITSLGHNLIGDLTGCTLTLQPSDLTGDPGLDAFTDNGRPGKGHFPLLPTSQAIDAGNDASVPERTNWGGDASAPVTSGRLRSAIETTASTTRRTTSTTRTRRPRPRRLSDQHAGASRRLGTACGGCRKRVSSGHNLSVPAPFNWAAPHPKFQAPVTSRFVPET